VTSTQIEVYESNAPLIHFQFTEEVFTSGLNGESITIPKDLTAATLRFILKADKTVADPAPIGTWTTIDAANGEADCLLPTQVKGTYWYRVDIIKAGATNTARAGYYVVKDG
jgi:hypothetical protein